MEEKAMSVMSRRHMMRDTRFVAFADPRLKQWAVENYGGVSGITDEKYGTVGVAGVAGELTYEQAAAVTNIVDYLQLHGKYGVQAVDLGCFQNVKTFAYYYNMNAFLANGTERIVLPPNLEELKSTLLSLKTTKAAVIVPRTVNVLEESALAWTKVVSLERGNRVYRQIENGIITDGKIVHYIPYRANNEVIVPYGVEKVCDNVVPPNVDTLVLPPTLNYLTSRYWSGYMQQGDVIGDYVDRFPKNVVCFAKPMDLNDYSLASSKIYVRDEWVDDFRSFFNRGYGKKENVLPLSTYPKIEELKKKIDFELWTKNI